MELPSLASFHSLTLFLSSSVLFWLSSGDLTTVLDIRRAFKSYAYSCYAPQHYLGSDHLQVSCLGLNAVLHCVVHLLLLNATIPCYLLRVYVPLDLGTHVEPCAVSCFTSCSIFFYFSSHTCALVSIFSIVPPHSARSLSRMTTKVSPHFQISPLPARVSRICQVC